jgi:hypothetical protein
LQVYHADMSDASLTNQDIELMFFVFGMSRFVTLLLHVTRIPKYGVPSLALSVLTTAVGMVISFPSRSILSVVCSINALFGLSTSVFYPVSFRLVTMNTPSGHLGSKLGVYNTLLAQGGWPAR